MARARTDTKEMGADLVVAIGTVRELLELLVEHGTLEKDGRYMSAFAEVETFCAIALRIIGKTNPSKVRSEAMTVEIQSLMVPSERKA